MLKGWSGRDIVKRVLRIGQKTHPRSTLIAQSRGKEITSLLPMSKRGRELSLLHRNRHDVFIQLDFYVLDLFAWHSSTLAAKRGVDFVRVCCMCFSVSTFAVFRATLYFTFYGVSILGSALVSRVPARFEEKGNKSCYNLNQFRVSPQNLT